MHQKSSNSNKYFLLKKLTEHDSSWCYHNQIQTWNKPSYWTNSAYMPLSKKQTLPIVLTGPNKTHQNFN